MEHANNRLNHAEELLLTTDMPNAEFVAEHSLVLPMFPELTQEEIDAVIEAVNRWEA